MAQALPTQGFLRVVSNQDLTAALDAQAKERAEALQGAQLSEPALSSLAGHIRHQYTMMQRHRNTQAGWTNRLLDALRTFNGQYSADQLAAISRFGGSDVYARIIAMKCRGATSLLRDVYLGSDRPWSISAPKDPEVPPEIMAKIHLLVQAELQSAQKLAGEGFGAVPNSDTLIQRTQDLISAARDAAKKQLRKRAKIAEEKVDELLTEGGFYHALAEFLVDLPLFPFAVIKGPIVRMEQDIEYENGVPTVRQKPKLFWERISPFDLWWTPGVSDLRNAGFIEKQRVTRAELNDLLDLPGYNADAVRAVLDEYGRGGLSDNWDTADAERAVQESRENPMYNQSGLISCLEFHGNVQGRMLIDYGLDKKLIHDEMRDYMVQAWLIGRHVIKAQLSPNPRRRAPYYVTSFEKVPGTPVGNALPDILRDIQEVCNATARTLVNNLAIASGPQVVLNAERLADGEDPEQMYPWKRWYFKTDPLGSNSQVPISFFQPNSNSQELLGVYQHFNNLADELSGIPRYLQGNGPGGGAGRTASGLAMLMGNANKLLQTVAANVDRDVIEPLLRSLYDMIMLTDTSGLLQGDEEINVMGVSVAVQRETQRQRQLEFLQITGNPMDAQIVGPRGRAAVLSAVAQSIGLDGERIVPSDEELEAQANAQQRQQMQDAAAKAQGAQPGDSSTADMGPRTNLQSRQPVAGGVG